MTKVHIPSLGEKIVLAQDWEFTLYDEYRNEKFIAELCPAFSQSSWNAQKALKAAYPVKEQTLKTKYGVTDKMLEKWFATNLLGWPFDRGPASIPPSPLKEYLHEVEKLTAMIGGLVSMPFTLPKGTEMVFDRIYIRKGSEDYNSVTFRLVTCPLTKKKLRFWARLTDVNQMEVV